MTNMMNLIDFFNGGILGNSNNMTKMKTELDNNTAEISNNAEEIENINKVVYFRLVMMVHFRWFL